MALRYAPRRVGCPRCAGVHVESMPWVRGKQQMTHALLVTLATWARALPWEQVARLFRCSWGTVATAVEEAVAVGLAHRDLDHLTHIGIDEISRKRGHVYVTNVYDLARKRLVWSGEGRTTDTLNAFFDFRGPEKTAALAGICCDMWQPYIDVIKDRAGQAVLVFDKFHIVSHLMKAVDQVRRDEIREKGPAHKALMHKTRFIWLKNPWNLTEAQHRRLSELEHLNLKINRAYLLKELFAHFWTYRRAGWAKRYLKRWFWWATHSRLPPLRDFAWMLRRHEKDILNYFRMPIDNGTVEGLNNKAKLIIQVPLRDRCSFGRLPWLISQALSVTYMAGERRLYLERNCRLPESPAHSRRRNREGPASSKGLNSQRGFGPAVEPRRKSRPRSTSLHGSSPCKCQRLSTLRWDRLPPSRPSTNSGARAGGRRLSDRRLHRWLAGTSASAPSSHGAADLLGLNRAHICVRNHHS